MCWSHPLMRFGLMNASLWGKMYKMADLNNTIQEIKEGNVVGTILDKLGDGISWIFSEGIKWFSQLGSGKLLTLILLGTFFYFSLKIVNKILKIILIVAIVVFIISVGYSWIFNLIR